MAVGEKQYLVLDTTELENAVDELRKVFTEERVEKIMYRVVDRVAKSARHNTSKIVPKYYGVNYTLTKEHISLPKISVHGGFVSGSVDIDGKRGSIGQHKKAMFKATGGDEKHVHPRIRAEIMKGKMSMLPAKMEQQGNQPPFINYSKNGDAEKLNRISFTRTGKSRLPIVKVVGIGVPQMPLNQAEDDVREYLEDMLMRRLEIEVNYELGLGRDYE